VIFERCGGTVGIDIRLFREFDPPREGETAAGKPRLEPFVHPPETFDADEDRPVLEPDLDVGRHRPGSIEDCEISVLTFEQVHREGTTFLCPPDCAPDRLDDGVPEGLADVPDQGTTSSVTGIRCCRDGRLINSAESGVRFTYPASKHWHMAEILAENLSGKAVMGSDGAELGMLYNITMDIETGRLGNLVINPDEELGDVEFETDPDGRLLVPVGRVQAVKDHMIIQR